jgi:hypothetical protein
MDLQRTATAREVAKAAMAYYTKVGVQVARGGASATLNRLDERDCKCLQFKYRDLPNSLDRKCKILKR